MDTREWTKRIREYMKMHHMAETGDGILAAVSGGADSVCLLLVLKELADELGIHLAAFHLNHGLRGEEADRDEMYVRELCAAMSVPLKVICEDVRKYAAENDMSEEEAGRTLRYQYLEQAAEEFGCQKIATAHHRDDNAETVLMNLFRGSGLKGLGGIRPVRGNIIRPLLTVTRDEVETYLYKKKVGWCEDSTNMETTYERNKIRNLLIPWVRENINGQAAAHVIKTAEFAAQADEYFAAQAEKLLREHGEKYPEVLAEEMRAIDGSVNGEPRCTVSIPADVFDMQPQILKIYLLRAMIAKVSGSEKDISSRHMEAICALTGPGGGKEVNLPYGLLAVRGYNTLEIKKADVQDTKEQKYIPYKCTENEKIMQLIPINGELKLKKSDMIIQTCTFPWEKEMEIPKNQCTKWFDYDTIKGDLVIRTRAVGDYYEIGGGKRKLLKRFFIDEKIPEALRDETLLLADGDHILWVIGHRISENYKVTNSTRTILEIRVHKGEDYGREN